MEWLFFQSQTHCPAHVRRQVLLAPSPDPEIQQWGPCHSLYKCTFPKSVSDAFILCALVEDVFRSLRPPQRAATSRVLGQSQPVQSLGKTWTKEIIKVVNKTRIFFPLRKKIALQFLTSHRTSFIYDQLYDYFDPIFISTFNITSELGVEMSESNILCRLTSHEPILNNTRRGNLKSCVFVFVLQEVLFFLIL